MSKMRVGRETSVRLSTRLDLEAYHKIRAQLLNWRIDSFIRLMEEKGEGGKVLPFVRGLHFSAQLIYAVRDLISESGLEVDWGHLLDASEEYCSRECDIIVHRPGYHARWDGGVMDFKFIKQKQAVLVISCKSYLTSGGVDKAYVLALKQYVSRIWLFAECCESRYAESISRQARKAGYDNFLYLYKWTRETGEPEWNESGWADFAKKLRKLKA